MDNAVKIKDNLFWVGARDYDIEVFDIIMRTDKGTTYNSYLIKGSEKTALIEMCKESFFDEFLERVSAITDISKIDYVITNHTEPDHSGSITKLVELNPDVEIVGSKIALKYLSNISQIDFKSIVVKDGDTVSLGNYEFNFISTPFLHWPDSMMTYVKELKTLFTCDVFGCHFCSEELFNDKIKYDFIDEYKYYYDAIFSPFKTYVLSALSKIENLEFDTIATGHGPILRENLDYYIDLYKTWSTPVKHEKPYILIAYVSAYGYTEKMAKSIFKGIVENNDVTVRMYDITFSDITKIKEKVEKADGILFGSPTILSDALPPVYDIINTLNPVIHKGKIIGAFGSYGWSGEAITNIEQRITQLKLAMPLGSIKTCFNPNDDVLEQCEIYGDKFAKEVVQSFYK